MSDHATAQRINGLGPAVSARLDRALGPAFAGALAFSATLLFTLQPMFAKMATPLLGGSPGVWNTALVFFQGVLLLGYLYAHALTKWTGPRAQIAVHLIVLTLGALVLPVTVSSLVGAPPADAPAFWLIALFAVSIGPAFFAISATAPLMQAWYARTDRADAHDPYHLYAASNVGSLGALIAYPILVEPVLTLAAQSLVWSAGYFVLAFLIAGCGLMALRRPGRAGLKTKAHETTDASTRWTQRFWWTLYAFAPSSLLVGVTSHITTDVASAPFLWVAPLALFLLTYVMAFARTPWMRHGLAMRLQGIAAAGAVLVMTRPGFSWTAELAFHLGAFFLTALVLHTELVRRRPHAERLTEFYFFMSLGGVLGGAFSALLAPMIFNSVLEYPLVFVLALLLRPAEGTLGPRTRLLVLAGFGALALMLALKAFGAPVQGKLAWLFLGAGAIAAAPVRATRFAFAGLAAAILIAGAATAPLAGGLVSARGFFGVHKVVERDGYRLLAHGTTVHGVQSLDPARAATPMSYYGPLTPIGQALATLSAEGRAHRVAAVGLGAGSVACYAQEGERWSFFEIDPLVRDIASNPAYFGFLSTCAPDAEIVIGDARLTLAREPHASIDVLLLDAFTSDVVPTHLLTREAFAMYLDRLAPDGVIIAHISNRVLDLEGPIADIAADAGAVALSQVFIPPAGVPRQENEASHVMLIARSEAALAAFRADGRWGEALRADGRLWTDDYVNIPGAMLARALGDPLTARAR